MDIETEFAALIKEAESISNRARDMVIEHRDIARNATGGDIYNGPQNLVELRRARELVENASIDVSDYVTVYGFGVHIVHYRSNYWKRSYDYDREGEWVKTPKYMYDALMRYKSEYENDDEDYKKSLDTARSEIRNV